MKGPVQRALRRLTQVTRPFAMRSAGTQESNTSVVRHVGRNSGRNYETPVVAVEHGDSFLIALPYGERTDWTKNVLVSGAASVVTHGQSYEVDQPLVIPMTDMTRLFGPKEQKLHRRFAVETCLRVHRVAPRAEES
jgi:deazaflavin-dependent oxidoreductase (nitroreductase family)